MSEWACRAQVLELADRYLLCGLKRLCEARLAAALAPDTAAALLAAADRFSAPLLLQARRPCCDGPPPCGRRWAALLRQAMGGSLAAGDGLPS